MTTTLTLDHLKTLTNLCLAKACALYPGFTITAAPVIALKSRRRFGVCRSRDRVLVHLGYNLAALGVLTESEVVEVVAHEVAHAVMHVLHGKSGHGWRWQSICSALGGDAKRVYVCDTTTRAALDDVLPPAKRARFYEWSRLGSPEWLKKANHARRLRLIELANRLNQADSVALRYGTFTGRDMLSDKEPGAVAAIVCAWGSN